MDDAFVDEVAASLAIFTFDGTVPSYAGLSSSPEARFLPIRDEAGLDVCGVCEIEVGGCDGEEALDTDTPGSVASAGGGVCDFIGEVALLGGKAGLEVEVDATVRTAAFSFPGVFSNSVSSSSWSAQSFSTGLSLSFSIASALFEKGALSGRVVG